jgi:hypothetical protein
MLALLSEEHFVHLRAIVFTSLATAAVAFGQIPAATDAPYQVRYASNLTKGDAFVNIVNTGGNGGVGLGSGTDTTVPGTLCANVYTFAPDEEIVSCCSCPVTPDGLVSLSATKDLTGNPLSGTTAQIDAVVIKILATIPPAGTTGSLCNNQAANLTAAGAGVPGGVITAGLAAWGTTLHANQATSGAYDTTETAFTPSTLSASEVVRLRTLCGFVQAQGSGRGLCNSCKGGVFTGTSGLGATASIQ